MAYDGIAVSNIRHDLAEEFTGGRISKIAQPEKDELLLTLKGTDGQKRLLISASPSLPVIYLTEENKKSPMTAPNFCMLLRKHISGGRIVNITQPGFERILIFEIEHLDDLGDLCRKQLIVELMGKHSNIIFCDASGRILDSIKHISANISSVREVLPGRQYFIPRQEGKTSPLDLTDGQALIQRLKSRPMPAARAIYSSYTGFSPLAAQEICYRSGIDGDAPVDSVTALQWDRLAETWIHFMDAIRNGDFYPNMILDEGRPLEFASYHLTMYRDKETVPYDTVSHLLVDYYAKKAADTRIHQKSADLRHQVNVLLERTRKKYYLQQKQKKDTEKRDKYRKYGEMIHAYSYLLKKGMAGFENTDYETGKQMQVPLNKDLTPMENAAKYFARYNKLKRTDEALTIQLQETKDDLTHLESIAASLEIAENEADLVQIRQELADAGYLKRPSGKQKKSREVSQPYHYRSSDGFDIYVGKNNIQNDALTFRFAQGNDWWFHAKGMPGSHVIVRCKTGELPDRTFEEAGRLAGYYSAGRGSEKVEIDYLQKKNVKKPNKAKPGFVVYYTNYSLTIDTDITGIERIE